MSQSYEKKDVSVRGLVLGAFATVLLIIVFIVGLRDYFIFTSDKSMTLEIVDHPNPELIEILKKDSLMLNGYSVIDKEKGIYKIPVDAAMKSVVRDYAK